MIRQGNRSSETFPDWDDVLELEVDVLMGPIQTLDDAIAKLKAIELSFIEGERTDGADMLALRQTIRWLRAQGHGSDPERS
jgi:hypothetical protein